MHRVRHQLATNDDWLALAQEDTLEPDLPICDSHHHLWDHCPDLVEPRYLLDEILTDLNSGHNIISTVFVQCGAMHKAWFLTLSRKCAENAISPPTC